MAVDKIHVGIVGAGLGGLAAAIGIARAGHKVTILEQTQELGEVGLDTAKLSIKLIDFVLGRRRYPDTAKFISDTQALWPS